MAQNNNRTLKATSSHLELDFAIHIPLPKIEQVVQNPNNQTLKELVAPNLDQQPLCIQNLNPQVIFELKLGLIHLLPIFYGLL